MLVVFSAILIAGCTSQSTTPTTAKPTATPIVTTTAGLTGCDMNAQDKATMVMMENPNLRNVSFCEVILWCGDGGTYNTMSLNNPKDSCPEALFNGLDKTALEKQYQVSTVSTNPDTGRKWWSCDKFDVGASSTIRDFDGLKTRYSGETGAAPDGTPLDLSAAGIPSMQYKELTFFRTSTLIFEKGKPVFLIDDANGTTWVNKNFQNGVDPTLNYAGMTTLGTRLKQLACRMEVPGQRSSTEDLVLKANGSQPIMWDELGGAYDACLPGVANYIP